MLDPISDISDGEVKEDSEVQVIEQIPFESAEDDNQGVGSATQPFSTRENEVKKAIDYAQDANAKYLEAQAQHEALPGTAALIAFPVGGVALGLTAQKTAATAASALGMGAASIIGLSSYLQNKPREEVYVTGAQGVQCLLANMEPYTRVTTNDPRWIDWTLHSTYFTGGDYKNGNQDLYDALTELDYRINEVEALGIQKRCDRTPQARKYASLLLKAAKAAQNAAAKAARAGDDFSRTAWGAPITIVNTTNRINNFVNSALISTEPSVQALASALQGAIPDSAKHLVAVNASQVATADAQKTAEEATAEKPKAEDSGINMSDPVAGVATSAQPDDVANISVPFKSLPPTSGKALVLPRVDRQGEQRTYESNKKLYGGLMSPVTPSEYRFLGQLQQSIFKVNLLISGVMRVVGTVPGSVNNEVCPGLAKKAGTPPSLLLDPDGDIPVTPGSKTVVTLLGSKQPYVRPLFSQNVCTEVTATLKGSTMDVAASSTTLEGFYPFFVGDGTTGRPFQVMVSKKKSEDTTDEVDACPSSKDAKTALRNDGEKKPPFTLNCYTGLTIPVVTFNQADSPSNDSSNRRGHAGIAGRAAAYNR